MSSYAGLAAWYDSLTTDVPYGDFADFYEAEFARNGGEFRLLLDLCCGTGTLSYELSRRGYELIGVDASAEMLMEAQEKRYSMDPLPVPPLFLNQSAEELDLYGTVDAAYCSLDGMNYIPFSSLGEVFRRLHLFVRPGGLLIFDLRTPEILKSLDGQVFVDEKDDVLCLWRADFDAARNCINYGMDIFSRERGDLWSRSGEEHIEYAHDPEAVCELLKEKGFGNIRTTTQGPQGDRGRLFVLAERL